MQSSSSSIKSARKHSTGRHAGMATSPSPRISDGLKKQHRRKTSKDQSLSERKVRRPSANHKIHGHSLSKGTTTGRPATSTTAAATAACKSVSTAKNEEPEWDMEAFPQFWCRQRDQPALSNITSSRFIYNDYMPASNLRTEGPDILPRYSPTPPYPAPHRPASNSNQALESLRSLATALPRVKDSSSLSVPRSRAGSGFWSHASFTTKATVKPGLELSPPAYIVSQGHGSVFSTKNLASKTDYFASYSGYMSSRKLNTLTDTNRPLPKKVATAGCGQRSRSIDLITPLGI
ncbi:hypothetical protein BGHDH14_bghG004910000003001 [Blumeria hordei DH14]|uniref:Uncharacterized protein n=1 Tax=Blumeria graminis f. sp. hordei (strain DH14) TaxID=546991 RepID=N1JGB2_BLUG1|nr:hypothetical protein BGHDH14_bghG004910000003001 [Blumeria hordei DH14]